MELTRRNSLVYVCLAALWLLVTGWQIEEHLRVRAAARAELRNRSKAISRTLSASIRGMRFRGTVRQEQLEPLLNELAAGGAVEPVKGGEILSVALLNASGESVASAGQPIDLAQQELIQEGERWGTRSVTLINPVDLGASLNSEGITNSTVVLPRRADLTNRVPEVGREPPRWPALGTNFPPGFDTNLPPPPPPDERVSDHRSFGPPPSPSEAAPTNFPAGASRESFRRPPWWARGLDPALIEKRSVHGLVVRMSTESLSAATTQDFWMRAIIIFLTTVSVAGSGLAWRNLARNSELQIRLVRASELNSHFKEMNLAAAGLAHETRNPLNIIRGLAHMISRQDDAKPEVKEKSREIVDMADKVAAQLNEFINYSRPREVRRVSLPIGSVVNEVVRTLAYDVEEKKIRLQVKAEPLNIEADEQLLRQALFNLVLNAVQAVNGAGEIQIVAERRGASEAALEVRDNGPGVAPADRPEIFKPYFTTQKTGTGLGLAVVSQIVQAHGWEIECLPNEPKGAIFRITHLKVA